MTTLSIRQMSSAESIAALVEARTAYAEQIAQSGAWPVADAIAHVEAELGEYPVGSTAYVLEQDGRRVGMMLLGIRDERGSQHGYIYGIYVDPLQRGRGFAREAMRQAEEELRRLGATELRLHVWGHNHAAVRLYEQLGFKLTRLQMRKVL